MEMKVPEYFASMVFDDAVMQERLPKETYRALKKTAKDGRSSIFRSQMSSQTR